MATIQRDPRVDPKTGDILSKPGARGSRYKRIVVSRNDNQIVYKAYSTGSERTCWLTTWMDWARNADVELYPIGPKTRKHRKPPR